MGLSLEASVRGLLAHEAEGYEEWGASAALRYDPGWTSLGLTASLVPNWGMATSGVGRLWNRPGAKALAGSQGGSPSPTARVDAELGYGLRTLDGQGVLTPFARASLAEGVGQPWHLGTHLELAESFNVSLETSYRQLAHEVSAQELALLATVPW